MQGANAGTLPDMQNGQTLPAQFTCLAVSSAARICVVVCAKAKKQLLI
jgi:hypothetical protein